LTIRYCTGTKNAKILSNVSLKNIYDIYFEDYFFIAYSIIIILTTYAINKINISEYYSIIFGLAVQLFAIVIGLISIDNLYLFIISILLSNIGITLYNIPMVSKIMSEIDRGYMSRALGTMSFISSITIPLSNYIYGFLIESFNVEVTLIFTLLILVISITYVYLRNEFKFNNMSIADVKA